MFASNVARSQTPLHIMTEKLEWDFPPTVRPHPHRLQARGTITYGMVARCADRRDVYQGCHCNPADVCRARVGGANIPDPHAQIAAQTMTDLFVEKLGEIHVSTDGLTITITFEDEAGQHDTLHLPFTEALSDLTAFDRPRNRPL
jgi:hypothetical protein